MVALQASESGNEDFMALPLAWSYPRGSDDIAVQFTSATNAMKAVFGFSEMDVVYDTLVHSRQACPQRNRVSKSK